ncbi:MAG: SGNH/GDSL hydrolase family protein [Cytophagales bacterium]|nr:SGNH/GDSL hydrolase family protein [Cytophagales bacterium]
MSLKTILGFLLCGMLVSNLQAQESLKISPSVKKIVFLGNSITYSGQYVDYVETYLRLSYPDREWDFINIGLPSETVSGLSEEGHADGKFPRPDLHERLDRVLNELKPDLIFANYGMNDGIYLPFDEERFKAYQLGLKKLHDKAKAIGADIIHSTPPVYDPKKGAAYANVLDIYASWLLSQQYTEGWQVIDIHWPMRKFQEDQRLSDPTFELAKDGVHPADLGHWIMARNLLLGIGEIDYLKEDQPSEVYKNFNNGLEILSLVKERQSITKDALLNHIGHKRPGMKKGLPWKEAAIERKAILQRINELNKEQ